MLRNCEVWNMVSQQINKKFFKHVSQGLVLIVFLFGVVSYLNFNKAVSLTVNGKVTKVYASGNTVSEILDSANIAVSPEDEIFPSLEEEFISGNTINVNHKKDVLIEVDGIPHNVSTTSNNVSSLLEELAVEKERAIISTNLESEIPVSGLNLSVLQEKTVTVISKDTETVITTHHNTVSEVLDEVGVPKQTEEYIASAPQNALVVNGMSLRVFQLERSPNETLIENIDFSTEIVENDQLFEGQTEITQQGALGSRSVSLTTVIIDGQEVGVLVDSDEIIAPPVSKIINKGIKSKPVPATKENFAKVESSGGLNWAALVQCEAGGNFAANTGNGYYGGLQFNLGTWTANGGTGYPHEASAEEQIRVGENLYASRGASPWPHCGKLL